MICGCECWYLAESVIEATRVNKSIESRWMVSFFSKRIVVTSKWYRVNTHYMRLNRMLEWYAFGAYVIICLFLSSIYSFFRCCSVSVAPDEKESCDLFIQIEIVLCLSFVIFPSRYLLTRKKTFCVRWLLRTCLTVCIFFFTL